MVPQSTPPVSGISTLGAGREASVGAISGSVAAGVAPAAAVAAEVGMLGTQGAAAVGALGEGAQRRPGTGGGPRTGGGGAVYEPGELRHLVAECSSSRGSHEVFARLVRQEVSMDGTSLPGCDRPFALAPDVAPTRDRQVPACGQGWTIGSVALAVVKHCNAVTDEVRTRGPFSGRWSGIALRRRRVGKGLPRQSVCPLSTS
jgi:hypothetical protein